MSVHAALTSTITDLDEMLEEGSRRFGSLSIGAQSELASDLLCAIASAADKLSAAIGEYEKAHPIVV